MIPFFRAVEKPGGGLRYLTKADADFGIKFPGNISAPAARKFVLVGDHGGWLRRTTSEIAPYDGVSRFRFKGSPKKHGPSVSEESQVAIDSSTIDSAFNDLSRVPPDSQPEAPLRLTSKQRRKAYVNDKEGNPISRGSHHRDAENTKLRKEREIGCVCGENE